MEICRKSENILSNVHSSLRYDRNYFHAVYLKLNNTLNSLFLINIEWNLIEIFQANSALVEYLW